MHMQWERPGRGFHEFPVPFPGVLPFDEGVYIIWQFTGPTIYVGQGHIAERLYRHSISPRIMQHEPGLRVTWANVEPNSRSGVEAYLASTLHPVEGDAFPDAPLIEVNLPPWNIFEQPTGMQLFLPRWLT